MTVGVATLASRLSGFARDIMIASLLGSTGAADAYIAAFLLPNLFRRMLSEGAVNAAFVPIFLRREAECGRESAFAFAQAAFAAFAILILVGLAVCEIAMPQVIAMIAPGFVAEPAKYADAVAFSRIAFVFVAAVMIASLMAATLNALGRYALAAFAPLALNVMLIASLAAMLLFGWRDARQAAFALVLTILAAGFVQLAIMTIGLARAGMAPRLVAPVLDADVTRLLARLAPGLALVGAGHLNMVVAAHLVSALPSAISWLYYGDRIFQLPQGFVSAAIGMVLLPEVARAARAADHVAAQSAMSRALEFCLLLVLPAALSIAVLAQPIVDVIYRRGAFSPEDVAQTARLLQALAVAAPFFAIQKVLLPPYLARESMRFPLLAALAGVAANILVTRSLIDDLGAVAAAIGVAAAAVVNAGALALASSGGFPVDADSRRRIPRIVAASTATAATAWALCGLVSPALVPAAPFATRALALAGVCVAGVLAHVGLCVALGLVDARALRRVRSAGGARSDAP